MVSKGAFESGKQSESNEFAELLFNLIKRFMRLVRGPAIEARVGYRIASLVR